MSDQRHQGLAHGGGKSLIPFRHTFFPIIIGVLTAAACGALWTFLLRPHLFPGTGPRPTLHIVEFIVIGLLATFSTFLLAGHALAGRSGQMALLSGLVENTTAGVWILDHQLRTVWSNTALAELLGTRPEPGSSPLPFLDAEGEETLKRNIALRPRGLASSYELTLHRPDGEKRSTLVLGSPVQDEAGEWLGSFGFFIDLTEQIEAFDRTSRREKLETLGAVITRLNHRINNALMVIRGQAEILLRRTAEGDDRNGPERIIEYVDVIYAELETISSLKEIEIESYPGGHAMLRLPDEDHPETGG